MKLTAHAVVEPATDPVASPWSALQAPTRFGDGLPLKSFQKVWQKVEEKEVGKEDIIVPFSDVRFVGETGAVDIKEYGRVLMSELAFSHLCMRLKIPTEYMMRCPLELRNSNMEYWVNQNDERKVLLRIRKFPKEQLSKKDKEIGVLRAVLPHTYVPIDNHRILDWVGASLDHFGGDLGIQSARIGEASTHIRLLFRKPLETGERSHALFFGVHVSDSEVGERGFSADLVSFIPEHETGFLHTADGSHLITQRHIHIDFKLLRRNFMDSFDVAEENREIVTDMLTRAYGTPVSDPRSYIRRLVRHHRLTNDFADSAVHTYDALPEPNKFGVAVALSRAATKMPIDDRVNTEALVGQYLLEGA